VLSLKAFLGLDASGYELGMKRAMASAQKFRNDFNKAANGKVANFLTAAGVAQVIRKTMEFAGEVNDLSNRLDVSTDAIQKWKYAAGQAGATIDHVAGFFEQLAVSREKALGGDESAMDAFRKLGVSRGDLQSLRLEDLGKQIGNTIKSGDAQKLVASLKEVGGKGATALIATFKAGIDEAFADAPVIKPEYIIELDAIGDRLGTLRDEFIATIGPAIAELFRATDNGLSYIIATIKAFASYQGTIAGGGSKEDAIKAAHKAVDSVVDDAAKRRKTTEDAIAANKAKGKGGSDTRPKPEVAGYDPVAQAMLSTLGTRTDGPQRNINNLQEMGALIRGQAPDQVLSELRQIRENTAKMAAQKNSPLPRLGTLGNLSEHVSY
jgi:hypothetical protein